MLAASTPHYCIILLLMFRLNHTNKVSVGPQVLPVACDSVNNHVSMCAYNVGIWCRVWYNERENVGEGRKLWLSSLPSSLENVHDCLARILDRLAARKLGLSPRLGPRRELGGVGC